MSSLIRIHDIINIVFKFERPGFNTPKTRTQISLHYPGELAYTIVLELESGMAKKLDIYKSTLKDVKHLPYNIFFLFSTFIKKCVRCLLSYVFVFVREFRFVEKEHRSGSVDKCRLELCVVAGSATDVVLRFDMRAQRRNMAFVGECENRGGERCRFTFCSYSVDKSGCSV